MPFLIDEDLPRSLAQFLRRAGFDALDVRDVGLRGAPDPEVFGYAVRHRLTLVTGDLGFANLLTYPLGFHAGILVVRTPNTMPATEVNARTLDALRILIGENLAGSLAIIDPRKIRLRRPSGHSSS